MRPSATSCAAARRTGRGFCIPWRDWFRYADRIDGGSFYVRIERRGHAGEIHSQPLEQELDRTLTEHVREQGATPYIDFKDPDAIVAVELIEDECGVGLITRAMRERFPFVKVP
jgi:tRNA(Ser,Leu) C12 N-acetylase TAN1